VNFLSQRAMVEGSLMRSDTTAEAHGTYLNRDLVPGVECKADESRRVATRVHAARGEETGLDGCPAQPTHCRRCGRQWGTFITDRLLNAESSWDGDICPTCAWDNECTPRRIPGAPRVA
jgi:hypothetical protein